MEKPACNLLTRLISLLEEYEPDTPITIFELLMDVAKYLKRECERERTAENPNLEAFLKS